MAPKIQKISNASGEDIEIQLSDDRKYVLNKGNSMTVDNGYIGNTKYTKLEYYAEPSTGYLLKYEDGTYNIMINDPLGKKNVVSDTALYLWPDTEYVNIDMIVPDEMKIWCTYIDINPLGVYQSDGKSIKYYCSVLVAHNANGGITVTGLEHKDQIRDVQNKEDKDEGEPSKD